MFSVSRVCTTVGIGGNYYLNGSGYGVVDPLKLEPRGNRIFDRTCPIARPAKFPLTWADWTH